MRVVRFVPGRAISAMYVCICNAVSDKQLREVVSRGAQSLDEVQRHLPVAECCGMCEQSAKETIETLKAASQLSITN